MNIVFVVKDNGVDNRISGYARESIKTSGDRCYYPVERDHEKVLKYQKDISEKNTNAIILLVSYERPTPENESGINSIFVGFVQEIVDNPGICYRMEKELKHEDYPLVIDSIVSKIDLDFELDFDTKEYVLVNRMGALYEDLQKRLMAHKYVKPVQKEDEIVDRKNEKKPARIYANKASEEADDYYKDVDAIVKSKSFRRMVDKAQVFSSSRGDHYRTRMTHTLEVTQIAKRLAMALGLDVGLTEAIALGHDIGHTPFGHQGERTLNSILFGEINAGIEADSKCFDDKVFGGFKHNYQSVRILTKLEEKEPEYPGLNISVQVLDGIIKHTKLKKEIDINDFIDEAYQEYIGIDNIHMTVEGNIVELADEIAQRGHDVDDAFSAGSITISEFMDYLNIESCSKLKHLIEERFETIEKSERLLSNSQRLKIIAITSIIVDYFIDTFVEANPLDQLATSDYQLVKPKNSARIMDYLERVIQKKVICNQHVARADYNAEKVIASLFENYYENPRLLPKGVLERIYIDTLSFPDDNIANSAVNINDCKISVANEEIANWNKDRLTIEDCEMKSVKFVKRKILIRAIVDYIAGMTDGFALGEYEKLM